MGPFEQILHSENLSIWELSLSLQQSNSTDENFHHSLMFEIMYVIQVQVVVYIRGGWGPKEIQKYTQRSSQVKNNAIVCHTQSVCLFLTATWFAKIFGANVRIRG